MINAVFVGQRSSVQISNSSVARFGEIFKLLGIFWGNFALSIRQHWTNKNHHFVANAEFVTFEQFGSVTYAIVP